MKLKNVNITLFVLASLLCLSLAFFVAAEQNSSSAKNIFLDSDQDGLTDNEEKSYGTDVRNSDTDSDGYSDGTEVEAGYNPLVKAPGDKLAPSDLVENTITQDINSSSSEKKGNLTEEVAQKISILINQSNSDNTLIEMDDIQSMLDSVMDGENFKNEVPEISEDEIKIKKQNYGNLSEEKAQEKKKEDALDYSTAVLYIFTSNSPEPLTSSADAISVIEKTTQQILSSFDTGSSENLNNLAESGEKIYEQLKEVEVPEDMVDTHMKALQYAIYAQNLKNLIQIDPTDPLANLANYSKIGSFVSSLSGFYDEITTELEEYGIEPEDFQNKLEDQGINSSIFIENE